MSDLVERLRNYPYEACKLAADRIAKLEAKVNRLESRGIEDMQDTIKQLEGLLRYAGCPDPDCDGKGTVCAGAYQHEYGEVEYDLHQCQWCDEKDQFVCTLKQQ